MTQPIRRAHWRIMLVLAVMLPAAFVAGILARRPAPPANPKMNWSALERP